MVVFLAVHSTGGNAQGGVCIQSYVCVLVSWWMSVGKQLCLPMCVHLFHANYFLVCGKNINPKQSNRTTFRYLIIFEIKALKSTFSKALGCIDGFEKFLGALYVKFCMCVFLGWIFIIFIFRKVSEHKNLGVSIYYVEWNKVKKTDVISFGTRCLVDR